MRWLLLLLFCVVPISADAAIVISEIAWMGTAVSPNDEWIELHNNGGSPVAVDGWVLKDSASLEIALFGTIAAGKYAVLERTDDATVAGTAFLIYTGALANTGSVLSLYKADATLEDQIAGGENWETVGGDNVTKKTAQHTSSGWKTAVATPGRGLELSEIEEDDEEEEEEENEDEESEEGEVENAVASDGDNKVVELQLPDVTLSLSMSAPDIVYVHQTVPFDVAPKGLGETSLNSLVYEWNFGDFATNTGKTSKHTYDHPGEYVVTVSAQFARHMQVARKTIKVLPVDFLLTSDTKGNILLHNDAKYEVNVSGYSLHGSEKMVFPERSVILAGGTIAIPRSKVGYSLPISLYDQKMEKVASTEGMTVSPLAALKDILNDVYEAPIAEASNATSEDGNTEGSSNFSFEGEVTEGSVAEPAAAPSSSKPIAMESQKEAARFPKEALPLLGLIGIVTLGLIGVLLGGSRDNTT